MSWDYALLDINPAFPGLRDFPGLGDIIDVVVVVIIIIIISIIIIIITNNNLFQFALKHVVHIIHVLKLVSAIFIKFLFFHKMISF